MTLTPEEIKHAFDEGQHDCRTLRAGDKFLGAFGHAALRGITREDLSYPFYVQGFLSVIPGRVVTDRDGRLIEDMEYCGPTNGESPCDR